MAVWLQTRMATYQLVRELGMINTASGIGVCVLLDQRHYLREVRAVKGSCQPAVECGQPAPAGGR